MDKEMLKKNFADFKNVFKTAKGADIAKGAIKTLTGKAACALVALVLVIGIASAADGSSEKSAGSSSSSGSSGKVKTVKLNESDFEVELTEDGAGVIIKRMAIKLELEGPTAFVIPEKIQGMPVAKIGLAAPGLTSPYRVKSITVPETVKEFREGCFGYYSGLESVNFPKSLEKVCNGAFANTELKKVTIKADIDWTEGSQFSLCKGLDEVTIEEGVEVIPSEMFNFSKIKKIVIPASVKKIEAFAFSNCSELVDVEFKSPDTALRKDSGGQQMVFGFCPKLSLASQAAIKKQPLY